MSFGLNELKNFAKSHNMPNQPHDYIFFADNRSSTPNSRMQIADQIASGKMGEGNRVFWVNIYTRLPKLSEFTRVCRILTQRGAKPTANLQGSGSTIISATPIQIPWFGLPARKFNGYFAGRFYQKLVKQYNILRPVLVTGMPCAVDAFRTIRQLAPQAPQIYYCPDNFVAYPGGFNTRHWETMEQELFATVDGATFTSLDLLQSKKRLESLPNLYLPHGVDYEHFSCENSTKTPIETLEKIKKPIIGLVGNLDMRIDISALVYLAKRFPQCSFVFIGQAVVPATPLEELDNVHLLGRIQYSELPLYMRYFDVGLIPYLLGDITKAINPLKMMEYYAAGMPVISSRLQNIVDMPGPLYIADTHEEYGDHLKKILHSDMSELRRLTQEIARQNSWAVRAESFVQFVEQIVSGQAHGVSAR